MALNAWQLFKSFRRSRLGYPIVLVSSIAFLGIQAGWHNSPVRLFVLGIGTGLLLYWLSTFKQKSPFASHSKLVENPFSDPGIFTYSSAGFTVASTTGSTEVMWDDIEAVFGYKVDLYTIDCIQLAIFYQQSFLCLTEQLAGWHPFLRRLLEQFPAIKAGWEIAIATPVFATNLTLLYEKNGLDLDQAQAKYYLPTKS